MSFSPNHLEEAISQAKKKSIERKQRKFIETVELSVGLRDIDLKNPSNRINLETLVPNDLGGKSSVAVFAEGDLATRSGEYGLKTIGRTEIEQLAKEPKNAKKMANQHAFFLAEPPLMAVVARFLGKILGPRGKMPKPIPPRVELEALAENASSLLQELTAKLPKGVVQIKSVYIKTTMGPSVKVEKS
jgi:large subunit ribosomal protein L1